MACTKCGGSGDMQKVPPGAIVQYYSDLASGVLAPEDMRIESLEFRVQINPVGQTVFNTDAIQIVSRYNLAIRRIVGFMMDPDLAGAAPSLVRFNVREQGRNFDIFKKPVNMQSLLSRSGSANVAEWDGVYIAVPGTQLEVAWTVDINRWSALVGATKEFGVQIMGDYVACAPE